MQKRHHLSCPSWGATTSARRTPTFPEGSFWAPQKGGLPMTAYVTYAELFAYTLVLIGLVALFKGRKKK